MTKQKLNAWTIEEVDIIKEELQKNDGNQNETARRIVASGLMPHRTFTSIQSKASKISRGVDKTGKRKYRRRNKSKNKKVYVQKPRVKKVQQTTFSTPVSKKPIASLQDLGSVTFKDVKYLEFVSEKTIVIYLK